MPKLSWISDAELSTAVAFLLNAAKSAKKVVANKFGKNVVDPFSAMFEISGFDMTYDEWVRSEETRQSQKTLQNHIGDFHQKILGSCKGWVNMGTGQIIDLLNTDSKIVAEVKNKHNTISGGKLSGLYKTLETAVMDKRSIYKDYTAFYVSIIPAKPARFDKEFTPSDNIQGQQCPQNRLIRHIDGASFYALVTGNQNALEDLFDAVTAVIAEQTYNQVADKAKIKALFKIAYG